MFRFVTVLLVDAEPIVRHFGGTYSRYELLIISYLLSVYRSAKKCNKKLSYVPLSVEFTRSELYGGKGLDALNSLIAKGIIDVKVIGMNKTTGLPTTYIPGIVCRHVKLNSKMLSLFRRRKFTYTEVKKKNSKTAQKKMLEMFKRSKELAELAIANPVTINVKGDNVDEVMQKKVIRFYSELTLEQASICIEEASMDEAMKLNHLMKLFLDNEIPVSIGAKSGRVFTPLITMSKVLRKNFRYNGELLKVIDGKSFHPHLLAVFIKDPTRRAMYLKELRTGDIYARFTDRYYSRDRVKIAFQIALTSGYMSGKSKEIREWLESDYFEIHQAILMLAMQGKSLQLQMQQLEAEIVTTFVRATNIPCMSMHDGLIVPESFAEQAKVGLDEAIFNRLGYNIPLTITAA